MRRSAAIDIQFRLDDLDMHIQQTGPGFSALRNDPAANAVVVYWHGPAPAAASRLAAAARVKYGTRVTFRSAPYTQAQLLAATHPVVASLIAESAGFSSASVNPDGSGVTVRVHGSVAAAKRSAVVRTSLVTIFVEAGEPPVPLVLKSRVAPMAGARQADHSHFYGGARIISSQGVNCSSGFGIHYKNQRPFRLMLTAAHCFGPQPSGGGTPKVFLFNGYHAAIGPAYTWYQNYDAGLINTSYYPGSTSAGWIYTGSWDSGAAKAVLGEKLVEDGDAVYTSGSFSGWRSGITVIDTETLWGVDEHEVTGLEIAQTNHTNAGGKGDSGGPVVTKSGTGVDYVGIISAGKPGAGATCTGDPSRKTGCYSKIYVALPKTDLDFNDLAVNLN